MRVQTAIATHSPRLKLRVVQTDIDRRFALLIFAILSTSLYIFHTEMVTLFLNSQLARCVVPSINQPNALTVGGLDFSCSWQPDLLQILGLLLGELLVLDVAVLIYRLFPAWKCWRERLEPFQGSEGKEVIAYLEELRQETIPGVRLRYVRDPLSKENPGAFGGLGTCYLTVPYGLVLLYYRDREKFRNVVLHELSHFYNKDVSKTYFAKAISYSFVLLALLPFMLFLAWSLLILRGQPAADTAFVLVEFWGAFPLAIAVLLIYKSILRSREVYADMQSAEWAGSPEMLEQALGSLDPGKRSLWRSLFESHPHADERKLAISDPLGVFGLKFWEAFGIGIAFAIAFPSIHDTFSMISQLLSDWLFKTAYPADAPDLGTLLLCLFAVPIIGQMIWRAMLVARMRGQELHGTGRIGLCLAAGLVLGFVLSLYFTPFVVYYRVNWQILLLYCVPLVLLLAPGLFGFCRWLALLASLWLDVVNTQKFFRLASSTCFAIAGVILAFGVAPYLLLLLTTLGSLLPGSPSLSTLTSPIALVVSGNIAVNLQNILLLLVNFFQSPSLSLALASLLMFPLLSWFWSKRSVPGNGFQWTPADPIWPEPIILQNPFLPGSVALIAVVGSSIFCGVFLALHQGLLHFVDGAVLRTYTLEITLGQLGLAGLFQAGIVAIIYIRTRPAGIVNGLMGALLSGCLMAAGTFDIYSVFGGTLGGPIGPDSLRLIFFLEVNWMAVCALGTVIVLWGVVGSRPHAQFQSGGVSRSTSRAQQKRDLLLLIPCILLLIGAIIFPKLVSSPGDQKQAASSSGIVKNGDFEEPMVSPNPFLEYSAGQSFQNWTVESGSIDLIGNYWVSAHGAQSVDLDGSNAGTIYQNVSTSLGATYSLSFYLAGNPICGPSVKQMQVWWGSTLVATLSFDITGRSPSQMGWQKHSYHVQATGDVTRLRFASLTQSLCGPALDAVSATAT